jgi:GrpB-like predicted nucleotidyltransferase (UPF0157 family)
MTLRAPIRPCTVFGAVGCSIRGLANRSCLCVSDAGISDRALGSTAVAGLGAKPIIDVLVGGHSLLEIEKKIPVMEELGYQYMPEHEAALPHRRFLAKPLIRPRQFHIHAVAMDSRFFVEHLLFRDALRRFAPRCRIFRTEGSTGGAVWR